MNVLTQPVMVLNANWKQLKPENVKKAFTAMLGGDDGNDPPALAMDQGFGVDSNGDVDWSDMLYAEPTAWEEWIKLPIRSYDLTVSTGRMTIRVPRIIIQPNYSKMPEITPRPTKEAIRKRDGGKCQYTGKIVSWNEGNIDHVIPRDQGGKNTWENMVLSDKNVNSKKANMTPEQAGLKLIRKPFAPKKMPLSAAQTIAHHPSWVPFMEKVTEVRGLATTHKK
jgi:hypothetical protein